MTRLDSLELRYALLVALHRAGAPVDLPYLLGQVRAWGLDPGFAWHEGRCFSDAAARKVLSSTLRTDVAKGG